MNPRKPTRLKLLQGTFRKDRAPKHEPEPRGIASCPLGLDPDAKAEWKRIAPELTRLGLRTSVDRAAFSAYCASYATWRHADKEIQEKGLTITTTRGVVKNPAVLIASDQLKLMALYIAKFGLSPSDRNRISATPKGDHEEKEDDFAG
jgi:P27 family predicted phage terminase small subunit